MIPLSATAEKQPDAFFLHYKKLGRPEASRALIAAIDRASACIARDPSSGLKAPRPYPQLATTGELWMKAGRYWVHYRSAAPIVILGVFYETADIPNRLGSTAP